VKTSSRPSPSKSSTRQPPAISGPRASRPTRGGDVSRNRPASRFERNGSRRDQVAPGDPRRGTRPGVIEATFQEPADPHVVGPAVEVGGESPDGPPASPRSGRARARAREGGRCSSPRSGRRRSFSTHRPASARRSRAGRPRWPGSRRCRPGRRPGPPRTARAAASNSPSKHVQGADHELELPRHGPAESGSRPEKRRELAARGGAIPRCPPPPRRPRAELPERGRVRDRGP